MTSTDFISMFLLGFLGTGHCLGMCGPLVFAFPGSTGRFSSHLWYHAGRIGTYTLCGALIGGVGAGLLKIPGEVTTSPLQWILKIQFLLSFFAVVLMFFLGLMRFGLLREPEWMSLASPQRLPGIGRLLKMVQTSPKKLSLLILGGVMGFIPCGLSYAAFVGVLPCGGFWYGGWLLFAFGMGTLPGLLFLGSGLSALLRSHQKLMELLAGLMMVAMAVRMLFKSLQAFL
ncbi:MAG: sulfite exporter TauE/SafE family protein [Desulfobacteraceae bacterium]|jgi:sulfite exporter TauE/SafE